MRTFIRFLICAVALPLALLAATSGPAGAAKDTIVIIQGPEPETLDTSMERGMVPFNPAKHILETMTHLTAAQKLKPRLAVSWKATKNATVWTFKIHPKAKFHDGTPVTAEDVVFTYKRIMNKKLKSEQRRYLKKVFKKVEALDPKTVRFHLRKPYAPLLRRLALIGIVPKHYVKKVGERAFGQKPMGAGPYKFVRWKKGQSIEMVAFDDYFLGKPKIRKVVFKFIREDATRVAALLSGEADIVMNLPTSYYNEIKKSKKVYIASAPSLRGMFLMINSRPGKKLSDRRLRKAMWHAINRKAIVKHIFEGRARVLNSPLTPLVFGYNPNLKVPEYSPQKAKKLLAEAGYSKSKPLKLNFYAARGRYLNDREVVQAIADDLRRVGIKINMKVFPWKGFRKYYQKYHQDVDFFMFSNANNSADANYNLALNFYSKGRGHYWNHPEADKLIEAGAAEADREKRRQLYLKAQKIIVEDELACVFLYNQNDLYGVSAKLKFKARPDESVYVYDEVIPTN